jgi:hypothetical protein
MIGDFECEMGDPKIAKDLLISRVLSHPGKPTSNRFSMLSIGFAEDGLSGLQINCAKVKPFALGWM